MSAGKWLPMFQRIVVPSSSGRNTPRSVLKVRLCHQSMNNSCGTKQQHSEKRAAAEMEGVSLFRSVRKIAKSNY